MCVFGSPSGALAATTRQTNRSTNPTQLNPTNQPSPNTQHTLHHQQVAVQFADLHDTPGRMAAVGVIRRAVPWAEARSFFYWRLRRRLAEFHLRKEVRSARECLIDWGSMDGP